MHRHVAPIPALLVAVSLAACGTSAEPTPTPTATARGADDLETTETLELVAQRTEELFDLDGGDGPEITLLDDDGLARLIEELLADEASIESLRRDEAFYSLLGLLPPDTDLLALNEELLNAGVAGLYRPEIDHLYVRLFGGFSSLEESTASHEYAHYLQDAGYDLEAMFDTVAGDRDAELALRALIEGDASYIQQQYVSEYFNEIQLFGMAFGGLLAASEAPAVPDVFTRETTFVYLDGQRWIAGVIGRGFDRAEVYANPPRTTREILHPETYSGADTAESVHLNQGTNKLPDGWNTAANAESIGELLLRVWLEEIDARGTASATDGWTGDAVRVFHSGDDPVAFFAQVRWETGDEAAEFVTVASAALDRDERYAATTCTGCPYRLWDGPAGVLALDMAGAQSRETMLAVAPSIEELKQMAAAVR